MIINIKKVNIDDFTNPFLKISEQFQSFRMVVVGTLVMDIILTSFGT